jgi:FkbM family methyltransferase
MLASTDHGPLILNRLDYNEGFGGGFYGVGCQLMENGCYDPREVSMLKDLLNLKHQYYGDGVYAIDCGANIGVHSVEWSRIMKGWGDILAIEAQERIFYALAGNLALQNCFNARAVWGAVGRVRENIHIPEPDYRVPASYGSFELLQRVGTENIGQSIDYDRPTSTVRCFTIDSLALERVDLIKLDVEGMELEALEGSSETIDRCKPLLFIEAIKIDKAELKSFLDKRKYKTFPHGMNILAVHEDDKVLEHLMVEREAA